MNLLEALFITSGKVWVGRGAGLPGQGKTEDHAAKHGCPEQVSCGVLGLGQGDVLLQAEFELLGAEEGASLLSSWRVGGRDGGAGQCLEELAWGHRSDVSSEQGEQKQGTGRAWGPSPIATPLSPYLQAELFSLLLLAVEGGHALEYLQGF